MNDIVDDVEIKPNKSKTIIKIVISVATSLVVIAFAFGQFKASFFNRMDSLEEKLDKQTIAVGNLETNFNIKIDKVYSDGLTIFNDFKAYNNKQLELIVDYGDGNKEMLKRMLEISSMKQQQNVSTQIEESKNEIPKRESEVVFIPVTDKNYLNMTYFIERESQDTIFNVTGATEKFVESIDKNKYRVGSVLANKRYTDLYDVSYRKK